MSALMDNRVRQLSLRAPTLASEREVAIAIDGQEIGPVLVELSMLLCRISESVTFSAASGPSVEIRMMGDAKVSHGTCFDDSGRRVRFDLGKNQLEYLNATLLRMYRDSMSDVDHIHLDAVRDGTMVELTVYFDVIRPPPEWIRGRTWQ